MSIGWIILAALQQAAPATAPSPAAPRLPRPVADPLALDLDNDPLIAIERETAPAAAFRSLLTAALQRAPGIDEAEARTDEAIAARAAARSAQLPSGDFSVSSYRTLAREFSNDPENIIERSRATRRTDVIGTLQQPLFDFGASSQRIEAARARVEAARARVEASAEDVGVRAISSWYAVFTFRTLVTLSEAFAANQADLATAIDRRIAEGVSARGDRARVDSAIAATNARLARYRRSAASAEARFVETFGQAPPAPLRRAPVDVAQPTREAALTGAEGSALVRAAEADAEAGRRDAKAARADVLPTLTAGVDAGRYGVFETDRDYDVRGRLSLRWRLFGEGPARADQADARARAERARAERIREEARRDASIAWSDVEALEEQLAALRQAYIASRLSRDVLAERFRVARGSLFDLLAAEDNYFDTATAYLQAITELDTARYVLLARSGGLLSAADYRPEEPARR